MHHPSPPSQSTQSLVLPPRFINLIPLPPLIFRARAGSSNAVLQFQPHFCASLSRRTNSDNASRLYQTPVLIGERLFFQATLAIFARILRMLHRAFARSRSRKKSCRNALATPRRLSLRSVSLVIRVQCFSSDVILLHRARANPHSRPN